MERTIRSVFRFFQRIFLLLITIKGLLIIMASGPLRDSPDWVHTLILIALAALIVVVGTVAIVSAVEAKPANKQH